MKSINTVQAERIASILLDVGAILFSRGRPFRFDSGILSPVYVDNRLLISYPKERKIIVDALVSVIKKYIGKIDVVAGVVTAGIPHAAWIADKINIPMVYVRAQPKDHGRKNQVEGLIRRGQKVLVVEDLISTANSSVRAINAIRKLGGKVTNEVAIFTYNFEIAQRNLNDAKVGLHYLVDFDTVTSTAQKKGYLKKEQVSAVLNWAKDPKNWAKKMGYEPQV